MTQLKQTLHAIDQLHAQDPEQIDGKAKELIYTEDMTRWLEKLNPNASDELRIAVRSQHLCRWEIARAEYPMDRVGYLKWRTDLGKMHARKASEIMAKYGHVSNRLIPHSRDELTNHLVMEFF
ncbi:DUF4202 domain-containing protein [Sansalvadorimonas sp. 2012CJ34-2]|uniref:DUF4202 domain-containing protein n=1 Tax=Parendozoicomonas callyspongiae TaxID=2942213 RepID=A0ABT0PLE3_9GAMM|nr:DUF4202 family protein [Sansalvadorimonas sp. 2012CJ34-2]MCL6272168.1 DUF4202 domain-containing protein [Sansalvadorimonas sp. 2012CJ34-2]